MIRTKSVTLALVLAATTLFAAGCGKMVKKADLEGNIKGAFAKAGLAFKSVSCPGDRSIKEGDKFDCTGELDDGSKATINITQKDAKGHFVFDIAGYVISEAKVSEDLSKALNAKIEAKCTKKLAVLKKGESFTCDYKVGEVDSKLELTVNDDEKTVKAKTTSAGQEVAAAPAPAPADVPAVEADESAE